MKLLQNFEARLQGFDYERALNTARGNRDQTIIELLESQNQGEKALRDEDRDDTTSGAEAPLDCDMDEFIVWDGTANTTTKSSNKRSCTMGQERRASTTWLRV